ncbi:MAG: hypothetical protein CM15mP77_1560 [Synechococcus sp.]|nr:MAG: hypothetical protein CM15mP77_1560 [Synechococcus sp.]
MDAVISLGGGWGGARVLEAGFRFPRRAKWSLGFSDTSSLLLASGPPDSQVQSMDQRRTGRTVAANG